MEILKNILTFLRCVLIKAGSFVQMADYVQIISSNC
jgi:hypothetical protein